MMETKHTVYQLSDEQKEFIKWWLAHDVDRESVLFGCLDSLDVAMLQGVLKWNVYDNEEAERINKLKQQYKVSLIKAKYGVS